MALPEALNRPLDILMIDNFDSFTWNLYQYLCLLGVDVTVIRNDAISPSAFPELRIKRLVISPGPGHPVSDSGISRDAIQYFTGKVPILGVCMGLECLVDLYGGEIAYAGEIMHGKVSAVRHDGRGCFKNIPQGIKSIRYHSLSAGISTLPKELAVTATTEESGVIMGVRHRKYTVEAVQYHPESILSESGDALLRNFIELQGGTWEENPQSGVLDETPPTPTTPKSESPVASTSTKIPTILEKICSQRLKDVEVARQTPGTTPEDLKTLLSMNLSLPLISFVDRLKNAQKKPALMAEIKRASPSKGPIAMSTNAAQQALTYALSGASVISVLTEPTWFKGSLLDMRLARQAIDNLPNRPAILRKDFILEEYQIDEARLFGADTVLLIVACLSEERLRELYAYSVSRGMEPLVEVNNAKEMEIALTLNPKVIGVNNRNLHDFQVDMENTSRLADMVKESGVILCALSGIKDASDVNTYVEQGVGAVLVGEALMRAADTRAFIRNLLSWPEPEPKGKGKAAAPLVKICGIRSEEEAHVAIEAGVDMIGLMFVPTSKRKVTLQEAQRISVSVHASRFSCGPILDSSVDENVNRPWFTAHAERLASVVTPFNSPARPLLVGVFQNQPLSFILDAISSVNLDLVQLHGFEPAEWAKHIPVPVIRVFHVDDEVKGLDELTRGGLHQFILLDAVKKGDTTGLSGGSGTVVDWDLARSIVDRGEIPHASSGTTTSSVTYPLPIILAGGLTPENVKEAVEKVQPWAVDVSGGVEAEDGKGKDLRKLRAFVNAVKNNA
ncbi:N-anthranilate isomerase [Cristinia sonorae]|uniref:Multifunctional tryptophan biosynthesis protein n=1 Tax=Cristinia sonorae TaxID=1940300 RepID=A0A8K0UMH0_9AGAR|nr:N-anthranilate isomerase [Cristinia sonorae]